MLVLFALRGAASAANLEKTVPRRLPHREAGAARAQHMRGHMRKYWKTATSGAFETSSNWAPTGAPGDGDLAFITATGSPYTVTTSTDVTVLGVSLSANATLDVTNSKTLTAVEGTATGTNLGVIKIEEGSRFIFGGVLNNQNTITSVGTSTGADFFVLGDTTLKGGGNFFLSDTTNNTVRGFDTLTNVDNLIAGAGTIETDIVNKTAGTIESTSGGNKLVLVFSNVTNTGMLLGASTAGLDLEGDIVTNIGGTIRANPGCFVYLEEGTKVIGGRLDTITNGDIVVKNAIFDGSGTHPITHDGNLEVRPPSLTGDGLYTQGVITNHGIIAINAGGTLFLGLPSSPGMDTTLQGAGQVGLDNSTIDLCSSTTLSKPLTLNNLDNTISGNGTIGSAATRASLVLNNGKLGIINANTLNKALVIDCNVVNSHLLEATGGGFLALFGNMVTNTAGTIRADTGSGVELSGIIKGGRLEGAGDIALISGATLDGSTSPLTNAGNVFFASESFATLKGTINNTGNIGVEIPSGGTGGGTVLVMAPAGTPNQMTLTGGGTLTLDEYGVDFIDGVGGAVLTTFANVNNTIAGAGRIGDRGLILKNGGTVNATGGVDGSSLVIDTGSRVVTNTGTMKATGGDLYIASPLSNTGVLIADAFSLVVAQASTGGTAKLDDGGQIEFGGPTTTAVRFDDSSVTSLVLDDSVHFKGVITNFGKLNTNQSIDLLDINPATATKTFTPGVPNVLTVKDAAGHTAQLKFAGSYTAANFHLSDDGHGGTLLTDPPVAPSANAALFGSHIASAFPSTAPLQGAAFDLLHTAAVPLLAPAHG